MRAIVRDSSRLVGGLFLNVPDTAGEMAEIHTDVFLFQHVRDWLEAKYERKWV